MMPHARQKSLRDVICKAVGVVKLGHHWVQTIRTREKQKVGIVSINMASQLPFCLPW